eukprot:349627-Chlamydomonas_euryale.AAC.10
MSRIQSAIYEGGVLPCLVQLLEACKGDGGVADVEAVRALAFRTHSDAPDVHGDIRSTHAALPPAPTPARAWRHAAHTRTHTTLS